LTASSERGALALVLHSHMPYVEGFGTWPFGEEWLFEAVATVYLPLLDRLGGAPVTIGLTPVLCDQFEALRGEAGDRLLAFLRDVRAPIYAEDSEGLERTGEPGLAAELRRAAVDYANAERRFEERGRDLVAAFGALAAGGPAELWTSPATHPVLPLLATEAGLRLQLATGTAAHTRRFGGFGGGLWLPECAYEPGLERDLPEHGVTAFCVDQTDALGLGALEHLEPVATDAGPLAVPIDWATVALVWDEEHGYPTHDAYRDYHARTLHDLRPWNNGGGAYDHGEAVALAREHAADFVRRAGERLDAYSDARDRPGLVCCALDAELLGHWWYEGIEWLTAVLAEAERQGVALVSLPAGLERAEPVARPLAASSWGRPKDLTTWDAPGVADIAFAAREAELRVVAAAAEHGANGARGALERAARELLLLQSSDWAFLETRRLAAEYPRERVASHAAAVDAALAALKDSASVTDASARHVAPYLDLAPLVAP
jgi:1,4-alpha-glucan branching enzyme